MERKRLYFLFALEAVLCILLSFGSLSFSGIFTTAISFPFEQIGQLLRLLSLSGGLGNILAILIYFVLCTLPLVYLIIIKRKRKLRIEDTLMEILSGLLFIVLYLMINPAYIGTWLIRFPEPGFGKALLGTVTYSLISGYIILRLLRLFFSAASSRERLQKYLSALMVAFNVILVYLAIGVCFGNAVRSFLVLRASNPGNESALSYLFLILRGLINALPYILDFVVVFSILDLLNELMVDRYSDASVKATKKLSRVCTSALTITVASNIIFNILQLLFMRYLSSINTSANIPLMSIIFVLATLLLSQFISENKQLKNDNDMFI